MDTSRRALLGMPVEVVAGTLVHIDSDRCLAFSQVMCRSCDDRCEPGSLRFRPQLGGVPVPQIDLATCTGCGECIAGCPQGALGWEAGNA